MMKKSLAVLGAALAMQGIAYASSADTGAADAQSDAPHPTWAAEGQLGFIMTSGTTTTRSGNASFDVAHRMGRWTVSSRLAALYASTGQYTTQQDSSVHLQADLELSKRVFWFSALRWDRNLFSGFAYQESVASGGGFKFIQTHSTLLAAELGVGYRVEKPETLTIGTLGNVESRVRVPGSVMRDAVLQAGFHYSHSITHSTKLENTLLVQYGSSDTTTTDNLSVRVKIDSTLSLALGGQLVNNTNPPMASLTRAGGTSSVRRTDTVMTINLVYALKNKDLSATAGTPVTVDGFNLP